MVLSRTLLYLTKSETNIPRKYNIPNHQSEIKNVKPLK